MIHVRGPIAGREEVITTYDDLIIPERFSRVLMLEALGKLQLKYAGSIPKWTSKLTLDEGNDMLKGNTVEGADHPISYHEEKIEEHAKAIAGIEDRADQPTTFEVKVTYKMSPEMMPFGQTFITEAFSGAEAINKVWDELGEDIHVIAVVEVTQRIVG